MRLVSLGICLLLVGTSYALAEGLFTRTTDFCPVDISYRQLADVVGRVRQFTQKANAAAERPALIDRISLEHDGAKFETQGDFSLPTLTQGPEVATSVRYSYNHLDQPISEVVLQFADYSRSVSISGTDRTQVDGLFSLVSSDLGNFGCSFGGAGHRMLGAFVLILTGMILTASPVLQAVRSVKVRAAFLTVGLCNILALVLVPWSEWLPGTAVRLADASLLVRNAALIGFIGTLGTVVSLVVTVVTLRSNRKPK